MQYHNIMSGVFVSRPNRFAAHVLINGQQEICHVKNTGRCKELLIPGVRVWLQIADNPARKTLYDVIAVEKNGQVVNIDSQVPNKIFSEWVQSGGLGEELSILKPEQVWGKSRFDFYFETKAGQKGYAEVKGATLEQEGACFFPDAPTERGVKHLKELIACCQQGYRAMVCFVIQMEKVHSFSPNEVTHPEFARTLRQAKENGVEILAQSCVVKPDEICIGKAVPVIL